MTTDPADPVPDQVTSQGPLEVWDVRRVRRPRWAPRSLRARIALSTMALMAAAMTTVGLGIQVVLDGTAQRDIAQVLQERATTVVSLVTAASHERLVVPANALEPGTEVFDDRGQLLAGSVELTVRQQAQQLGMSRQRQLVSGPRDEIRLLAVPVTTPSGDRAVVVVSQATGPYERSEFYALLATGALAVLVVGVTGLIALRVTRQALVPVERMAQRASQWSEHDLASRFAFGPPTDELSALARTLDHLLDRVAAAILSEQRLTAELAHELRTPLTSIQGSAGLALMRGASDPEDREDLEQIRAAAREMAATIDTLLSLARDSDSMRQGQWCRVADLMPGVTLQIAARRELSDQTHASRARVAAPRDLVLRALAPLLDNAVIHARHRVDVLAADLDDHVEIVVADDGPGVASAVRDTMFAPGVTSGTDGAGLGLGIARRVARSFGGEVQHTPSEAGARFVLRLPRR